MAASSTSLAEARALLLSPLGPVARAGSNRDAVKVSFEFFPPKTDEAEANLWKAIRRLEPLRPDFVSVTYGAGGSTRERTHRTVQRIIAETSLRPAAHLTCVEASRVEVDEVIEGYKAIGVDHIVALRGDPPNGAGIGGVYPEQHPESPSIEHDIDVLKAKVDAGATRALTQFFFDIDAFLRFRDRVRAAGVSIPLIPGIMPVSNFAGLKRMSASCGAAIPSWLEAHFGGLDDDPETRKLLAASVAAETCARLQEEGFSDFHFYTLNRADLVYAICRVLGVREAAG